MTEKNYITHFIKNPLVCFRAKKVFWQEIDTASILTDKYYFSSTLLYISENEFWNAYKKIDETAEIDKPKKIVKEKIKYKLWKEAICCPECHKVHYIEDFIQIKPGKEDFIKKIKETCTEHWYSLFGHEINVNPNEYFESLYDGYNGPTPNNDYLINHPDDKNYHYFANYYYHTGKNKTVYFYPKLLCPDCGCSLTEYDNSILSIFDKFYAANSRLEALSFFNDEKKIAVSALYHSFYINVDALKIAREDYRVRYTFNLKTGQTYFIGPKKLNGKKMPGFYGPYLNNITYRPMNDSHYICCRIQSDELFKKEVLKLLMERNNDSIEKFNNFPRYNTSENEPLKNIDEINFRRIGFIFLTIYNRFPCLNGNQIMNICKELNSYPSTKKIFSNIKRDFSASQFLNTLIENTKIPNTKKIRKCLAENPVYAKDYLLFRQIGFSDINIFYSFIKTMNINYYNVHSYINSRKIKSEVRTFIKDMIKYKGEPKTFNTFFKNNSNIRYIADAANMYMRIKENDIISKEYYTDDIKKIHDRLSKDYNKIKLKNRKIPYSKKTKQLNLTLENGIEFNLAEDTNELVRIGQELKICVGSYREKALNSDCIIISMKENDKYIGCIELNGECKELVQAKAKFNNLLQEKKAEALKTWIELHNIHADKCYDYQHILKGNIEYDPNNIYINRHDYHYYELDENGEVIRPEYVRVNIEDDELPFQ